MVEFNPLIQEPFFNLTYLDFFNLDLSKTSTEWEKFIEDFLLLRYYSFRTSFIEKNYDTMRYFLILVEGNFLVLKSELVSEILLVIKTKLENKDYNFKKEYINFISLARIIIYFLIELLKEKGENYINTEVKFNKDQVKKFFELDSELDNLELPYVKSNLLTYERIKDKVNTKDKIGRNIY